LATKKDARVHYAIHKQQTADQPAPPTRHPSHQPRTRQGPATRTGMRDGRSRTEKTPTPHHAPVSCRLRNRHDATRRVNDGTHTAKPPQAVDAITLARFLRTQQCARTRRPRHCAFPPPPTKPLPSHEVTTETRTGRYSPQDQTSRSE
jgi:hypothetical protein